MTNIIIEFFNAIAQNDLEKIKKVKEQRIISGNACYKQLTALGLALSLGKEDVVKLLLEFERIDVNQPTQFRGKDGAIIYGTPLSICVHHNKPSLLQTLLEKNADPNLANQDKSIPLMWAFFFGHTECVNLLSAKSDWQSKDKNGLTVHDLHIASQVAEKDGYSSLYQYQKQHKCSHPALIARFKATQSQTGSAQPVQSLLTQSVQVRSVSAPALAETKKKTNQNPGVTRHITKKNPSNNLKGLVAKIKNLEAQIASKDELIESLRKEIEELKSLVAKQEMQISSTTMNCRYESITDEDEVTTDEDEVTTDEDEVTTDEDEVTRREIVVEEQDDKREDQDNRQTQQSEYSFFTRAHKLRIDYLLSNDDNSTPKLDSV
ncbi:hypothetical protein B6N58_11765 [Legionella micdadei]|uniref:ankyrin repeat domain-containing protein n=1 Tax=Legionella micdadei TaxID=451 RepID=UPI00072EFC08|nr:ankyrin repeat domain-containing protein [Legionella micdadei]ARG98281.1 hypothetical protein B6N58_11765 [Legionella micdadei]KTD27213.1 Ankyrin repeats (3 copies) [Legionella micdadei]